MCIYIFWLSRDSSKQNMSWTCIGNTLWKSVFRTGSCSLLFLVSLIVFLALGHLVLAATQQIKFCKNNDYCALWVGTCSSSFSREWMLARSLKGSLEVISLEKLPTQEMEPLSSKLPSNKISQKGRLIFRHHFPYGLCYLADYFLSRTQILILGA